MTILLPSVLLPLALLAPQSTTTGGRVWSHRAGFGECTVLLGERGG